MIPLLEQHREALIALCKKHGIKRLDVFGSAVRGDFSDRDSDVDFLYDFDKTTVEGLPDRYFGFIEDAERLLGRPIDMVYLHGIDNRYFAESVNEARETLYAA
jgi:uncharacterized protein